MSVNSVRQPRKGCHPSNKTTPPASRVRAADRVLDHAAKATALEDIEARIAELERAVNPSHQGAERE